VANSVRWADITIALGIFLVSIAYFSLTFTHTFELRDEGYLLHCSMRVALGEVPHRDFQALYGPGVCAVNGLLFRIFGFEILPVRIVLALFKAAAVVLTFMITRFLVTRPFAVFGALPAMAYWGRMRWNLNTPYAALYTIPICMLGVYLLIRALNRDSARGYFAAGLAGGTAILFKQSLALFNGYGMFLAVWAVSMLEDKPERRSLSRIILPLSLWLLAGLGIVAPFISTMTLYDYLLHFLPLHLFLLLVGACVLRREEYPSLTSVIIRRFLPLILGLATIPLTTAAVYAGWGSLHDLIFNMFVFPRTLQNYYVQAGIPPYGSIAYLAGCVLLIIAILAILGRKRALGLLLGGAGVSFMCFALFTGSLKSDYFWSAAFLWRDADRFGFLLSPALFLGGVAFLAPSLCQPTTFERRLEVHLLIPLLLFHAMMNFQVYPRAYFNLSILQGALVPLLVIILFKWYRLGCPPNGSVRRRIISAALVALVPFWLVARTADEVLHPNQTQSCGRSLDLPGTAGLKPSQALISQFHLDDLEKLIRYLRGSTSESAPIFLIGNEEMILFLAGRPSLFPERELSLFLAGWGMLPASKMEPLNTRMMIMRLRDTPQAIIIDTGSYTSKNLRAALPELVSFIDRNYEVRTQIGVFKVLRWRGGPEFQPTEGEPPALPGR
jgi:hypothetical protein